MLALGRGLAFLGKPLLPVFAFLGFILTRLILLPLYKIIVLLRIRFGYLIVSARSVFFLLFTNRYVFHTVLLGITIVTVVTQMQTKNASASDAGQSTLLYALVTNGEEQLVQEQVRPELLVRDTRYLGADTIEAVPDIDYDYEESDQLFPADLTVPGSIAVQPTPLAPETTDSDRVIQRTKTETYAVKSGDTVASIARTYGVTVATIVDTNDLKKNASIKPGETLKILPVSGVLHTIKKGDTVGKLAKTYRIDAEEINAVNHISAEKPLALGEEIILPGAVPIDVPQTVAVRPGTTRTVPGATIRSNIPRTNIKNKSVDVYQELIDTKSDTRFKPSDVDAARAPSTKLLWPTTQHVITQYYGWKHTGVDLDGDYADAIYAAADGIVETAGWNSGGYGLQIIIDHQNGYRTRYAHSSKLFVQAGDHVKRGQVIAMVGTTGRSTGTHLHFEVYVNGKRANPLAYIR